MCKHHDLVLLVRLAWRVSLREVSAFTWWNTNCKNSCVFEVTNIRHNALMNVLLIPGRFNNRCVVPSSPEYYGDQVCGIPVGNSDNLPAFCASLGLLDQPYTCGDVS